MKIFILLTTVFTMGLSNLFAQNSDDTIRLKRIFGGYQFYEGERKLNLKQVVKTMEDHEPSYKQIKSAQSTYTAASIVGVTGGLMVGWSLGFGLNRGEFNGKMAGVGGGLIVISLPITQKFIEKTKQAVVTYNSRFDTSKLKDKHDLNLSITNYGIGLSLRLY